MSPRQLEEQRAATPLRLELEERHPVASHLLQPPELRAGELSLEALVEGALWSRVALQASVLEVESPRVSLAGEIDPEDRDLWAASPRDEGQDGVLGGACLHVAEGGPLEERGELFNQLADLSVVEVQLSSSSE